MFLVSASQPSQLCHKSENLHSSCHPGRLILDKSHLFSQSIMEWIQNEKIPDCTVLVCIDIRDEGAGGDPLPAWNKFVIVSSYTTVFSTKISCNLWWRPFFFETRRNCIRQIILPAPNCFCLLWPYWHGYVPLTYITLSIRFDTQLLFPNLSL